MLAFMCTRFMLIKNDDMLKQMIRGLIIISCSCITEFIEIA